MSIVKHIFIWILAVNMLASSLAVPLIYMEFSMRQDYISKVLCINRSKPITQCNGKCYLTKKLEKAQQTHEEEKEVKVECAPSFFVQHISTVELQSEVALAIENWLVLDAPFVFPQFLNAIFKPPRC